MHYPPLENNFCDEQGKAVKLAIIQDTRDMWTHLNVMMNSYSISRQTWKWTKKLLLHILDLTILLSFIILTSCGSKCSLTTQTDMDEGPNRRGGKGVLPQTIRQRRQAPSTSQLKRLKSQQTLARAV